MTTSVVTDARVPPVIVTGLLALADERGVDTTPWWVGTGLTRADVEAPHALLTTAQTAAVLRRALSALPPGPVALLLGSRDVDATWGALGVALRSARDGAELLATAVGLHAASGSLVEAAIEPAPDGDLAVVITPRVRGRDLLPFLCEESISTVVVLTRAAFGPDRALRSIDLPHPAPPWARLVAQVWGCPVRYDAPRAVVRLPSSWLTQPVPTADPVRYAAALDATEQVLARCRRHLDLVAVVEDALTARPGRPPTMAEVAAGLGVTERTLRRRLDDAGCRFAELRDRVRLAGARALLAEGCTVTEVARRLGFSEPRELRRAYRRWTGHPPSRDRRAGDPQAPFGKGGARAR